MDTTDPIEWEKLLAEKSHSHDLAKGSTSNPPNFTRLSKNLLRTNVLAQTVCTLGTGSSHSLQLLAASIWHRIAEMQAEVQLRRLAAKTKDQLYRHSEPGDKVATRIRSEWFQLQNLVFQGRFSSSTKSKVVKIRAQILLTQLSAQASPPPAGLYEDLVELASIICSHSLPKALQRLVWDMLLSELRRGSAHHLVAAINDQNTDVIMMLRHLAACKLTAWKTIPSEHSLDSTEDAKHRVRRQAFVWDAYDEHVSLTTGFCNLLLGLLERLPRLVHAAFDESHIHLLWLPKYLADKGTYGDMIEMSYVLDDLSRWYHSFPKRLNATPPHEVNVFVRFVSTGKDDTLLKDVVEHLRSAVFPLSQADSQAFCAAVDDVYRTYPSIKDGELAHPALPFLLFAAHLLPHSLHASEMLFEGGFLEVLRDLWVKGFPIASHYETGKWVRKEMRLEAMRLAAVLALGAMTMHDELRPRLTARLMATDTTASWFWDIAAHALYLQLSTPESRWETWCSPVASLAMLVMEKTHTHPGDYDLKRRLEDPQSLVWIFQTCGNPTIDRKLSLFSLDCLLHLAAQPTIQWKEPLKILDGCNEENVEALEQALSLFQHCVARSGQSDAAYSLQTLHDLINARGLFMTNPFDRFVMLMSNAARKNWRVSRAFAASGASNFVDALEAGRFDLSELDEKSASWRARTCYDVRLKLVTSDS